MTEVHHTYVSHSLQLKYLCIFHYYNIHESNGRWIFSLAEVGKLARLCARCHNSLSSFSFSWKLVHALIFHKICGCHWSCHQLVFTWSDQGSNVKYEIRSTSIPCFLHAQLSNNTQCYDSPCRWRPHYNPLYCRSWERHQQHVRICQTPSVIGLSHEFQLRIFGKFGFVAINTLSSAVKCRSPYHLKALVFIVVLCRNSVVF